MSRIKRLWRDEELIGMPKTISLLRKMRTAAVMHKPTISLSVRKILNHLLGGQEQIYSQQEALLHAEELADAAGNFFAAKLSKTTQGNTEFQKWQDLLSDAGRQYNLYGTTTYARTSLGEVVGNSIIGRLRNVHIDPKYMMQWDLLENNNLGADSIEKLVNQDIGVISPLSGDYLMASVYSSYLRCTIGKSFPTHAAALSRDLSKIVLPINADGHLPFEDKPAIGLYIDTTQTGDTARVLFRVVQEMYPQKTIHRPKFENTEFVQSDRIKKYWETKK